MTFSKVSIYLKQLYEPLSIAVSYLQKRASVISYLYESVVKVASVLLYKVHQGDKMFSVIDKK